MEDKYARISMAAACWYFDNKQAAIDYMIHVAKREILADVASGRVPRTVPDASALHDHVDANMYGHSSELLDEFSLTQRGEGEALGTMCDIMNPAMDAIDTWIKSGALLNA